MKILSRTRKSSRFLLLVALVAGLVLPAAPAATQEDYSSWSLTTKPVTFKAGKAKYQLTVMASETFQGEVVQVSISRVSDPKGVRYAVQTHTYVFDDLGDVFDHANNLSTASLSTGKALGKWGRLNLKFTRSGAIDKSCGGNHKTRAGKISGSLELKTGTKRFGDITKRPAMGLLSTSDGAGCGAGATPPCPPRGLTVSGYSDKRRTGWSATKTGKSASASFYWIDDLDNSGSNFLSHSTFARLPAKKVTIAKNLSRATIRGAKGTWISGETKFSATSPAFPGMPHECGRGKEAVHTARDGTVSGSLKAASFLGKGVNTTGTVGVIANKTVVRNR